VTSPLRPARLALLGYPAIAGAAWLAWRQLGAEPFESDRGAAQAAAALLFALAGASAYRFPGLPFAPRALLAAAGAWLAVDEWLMVHEALKFGPLAGLGLLRETPMLLYGLGGAAVALAVAWRLRAGRDALLHAAAAALFAGAVLLLDVGGGWRGGAREVVEETAELLAAWGAVQFGVTSARGRPSATWPEALAVTAWSALCLGTAAWLLKPLFAPARFL
jgi:hypothetical protein